jgi:hypothetical protein
MFRVDVPAVVRCAGGPVLLWSAVFAPRSDQCGRRDFGHHGQLSTVEDTVIRLIVDRLSGSRNKHVAPSPVGKLNT